MGTGHQWKSQDDSGAKVLKKKATPGDSSLPYTIQKTSPRQIIDLI